MRNPNTDGPSYIRISGQCSNGDPFGNVEDDHFVIIGSGEDLAYLINNKDKISSTNQNISGATAEEIVAQINAAYPSVGYLSYQIKNYSVGDKVNIGGEV